MKQMKPEKGKRYHIRFIDEQNTLRNFDGAATYLKAEKINTTNFYIFLLDSTAHAWFKEENIIEEVEEKKEIEIIFPKVINAIQLLDVRED